ncbi:MAG TPA: hypothetical protein VIW29_01245, partial [Polyangiaceae bacterium]
LTAPPPPLPRPPLTAPPPPRSPVTAPPPPLSRPPAAPVAAPPIAHAADDPAGYRFLYQHFERKGDRDGAYRAALCLEALGEADINESLLVASSRPEGLQAIRGTLSYADWNEHLALGASEPETTALLRALGPALGRVGFQYARRQRRTLEPPAETRQQLDTSTTTLARTLQWASRLLCVPASELVVLPELVGTLGLLPAAEQPLLACGRALGSGFSLAELAFLWARELSFARPEAAALCYFPSVWELSQLLEAALAVGGAAGLGGLDTEAKRIASGLKREVRGAALEALVDATQRFDRGNLAVRASEFTRAAELVAGRVALTACGDLELALGLAERFPRGHVTGPAERRADLLRFTVSPQLGRIRTTLGVALG